MSPFLVKANQLTILICLIISFSDKDYRYFRSYEQNVQPFLPMLLDPEGFETRLCEFVERIGSLGIEAALNQVREENSFCDAAWHAVLFGVLACGCQHSDHAICERIPRARVFGMNYHDRWQVLPDADKIQWQAHSSACVLQTTMECRRWIRFKLFS